MQARIPGSVAISLGMLLTSLAFMWSHATVVNPGYASSVLPALACTVLADALLITVLFRRNLAFRVLAIVCLLPSLHLYVVLAHWTMQAVLPEPRTPNPEPRTLVLNPEN